MSDPFQAYDGVSERMAGLLRDALADTVADIDPEVAAEVQAGKLANLDEIAALLDIPPKPLFLSLASRMRVWHGIKIGVARGVVLVPRGADMGRLQ